MFKKLFTPFEFLSSSQKTLILGLWVIILFIIWTISSTGDVHLFPSIKQVIIGLKDLWYDGLVVHIFSSFTLFLISTIISIIISLTFCYSTPIPFLKPIGLFVSKLRYLPLTGISFYISILIHEARSVQFAILVVFMTTFLTTSLLQMLTDIPEEELDHARTLGCSRWEILLEVVIKGRLDYVFEMVRQNLAMIWVMLVTVESILASAGGLGFLIKNNDKLGDNGKVIALQIIILCIGGGLDLFLTKTRQLIFRYSNF